MTRVPLHELEFSYSRSSGPGGQNVNKVNSKATMKWNLRDSRSIADWIKSAVFRQCANRISSDGCLVLASDRHRDQRRNRDECIEKLRAILARAATPEKPRKATRPSRSSVRERIQSKRVHSQKKKARSRPIDD